MIKGVFLVKRKPTFLRADFKRYWKDVHAPLALKLPGLRRYVQSHAVDEAYEWAEPRWDGVAHLYFDDAQAAEKAMTSDVYLNESGPDVDKFIGTASGLWVQDITYCRWTSAPNKSAATDIETRAANRRGPRNSRVRSPHR